MLGMKSFSLSHSKESHNSHNHSCICIYGFQNHFFSLGLIRGSLFLATGRWAGSWGSFILCFFWVKSKYSRPLLEFCLPFALKYRRGGGGPSSCGKNTAGFGWLTAIPVEPMLTTSQNLREVLRRGQQTQHEPGSRQPPWLL